MNRLQEELATMQEALSEANIARDMLEDLIEDIHTRIDKIKEQIELGEMSENG